MTTLLVGWGNELRGDDAVGLEVVRAVESWAIAGVRVLEVRQLFPELAADIATAHQVILVDASVAESRVRLQTLDADAVTPASPIGPHHMNPCMLLSLTRQVYGSCPPVCQIEIPAVSFELGAELSATACEARDEALLMIWDLLA